MKEIKIAPSILAADFARLADAVQEAERGGADWIHVDVMDGHFVPNLTIGPPVAAAVRKITELPLDAHLMISSPDRFLEAFADAGVDRLTVHVEACTHLHRVVERIHELGMKAGVALNPATPVDSLADIVEYLDLVLVMSVNPGFGGQSFIASALRRIGAVRALLEASGVPGVEIQVDGGITRETSGLVVRAGATVLVAGSAVFGGRGTVADNIMELRDAAQAAPGP
jgi:ribulose-phosphate 3-epimerase